MEIKKYFLNDPSLLRAYAVKENVSQISYYVVDDFLDKEKLAEVSSLLSKYDSDLFDSKKLPIPDNAEWKQITKSFDDQIIDRCLQINKDIFNLDIDSVMYPKYTVYKEGRDIDWHVDGPFAISNKIEPSTVWRKLSVSIDISSEEYTGGELDIIAAGVRPEVCFHTIKMAPGTAVFFPAFLMHRVRPIIKGTRKSLIYWFCGPRWQ